MNPWIGRDHPSKGQKSINSSYLNEKSIFAQIAVTARDEVEILVPGFSDRF